MNKKMYKLKKILVFSLIVPLLAVSLSGCGDEDLGIGEIFFSDLGSTSTDKFKEHLIDLEDGRRLLCIENKNSNELSCDWNNSKIIEEVEEPQSSEESQVTEKTQSS